jgi:hypothetical protein
MEAGAPHDVLEARAPGLADRFFVGSMIYTMSDAGQLSGLSGGLCDASQTDIALDQMTAAFVGLFSV